MIFFNQKKKTNEFKLHLNARRPNIFTLSYELVTSCKKLYNKKVSTKNKHRWGTYDNYSFVLWSSIMFVINFLSYYRKTFCRLIFVLIKLSFISAVKISKIYSIYSQQWVLRTFQFLWHEKWVILILFQLDPFSRLWFC